MRGNKPSLQPLKQQFHRHCENSRRDCALKDQVLVVQAQARDDWLAKAAGTHERGKRCCADTDDGSGFDARENRRGGQWQLDVQ